MVHEVAQAHDPETDAPCAHRCFAQRGDSWYICIGRDNIVQETRSQDHAIS